MFYMSIGIHKIHPNIHYVRMRLRVYEYKCIDERLSICLSAAANTRTQLMSINVMRKKTDAVSVKSRILIEALNWMCEHHSSKLKWMTIYWWISMWLLLLMFFLCVCVCARKSTDVNQVSMWKCWMHFSVSLILPLNDKLVLYSH